MAIFLSVFVIVGGPQAVCNLLMHFPNTNSLELTFHPWYSLRPTVVAGPAAMLGLASLVPRQETLPGHASMYLAALDAMPLGRAAHLPLPGL